MFNILYLQKPSICSDCKNYTPARHCDTEYEMADYSRCSAYTDKNRLRKVATFPGKPKFCEQIRASQLVNICPRFEEKEG